MANKADKSNAWDNAAELLRKKGYEVTKEDNQNGTPVYTVTNLSTGKSKSTRYPGEIIEFAESWPKINKENNKSSENENNEKVENGNEPVKLNRRQSDMGVEGLKVDEAALTKAITILERNGILVELPMEQGGNYTLMGPSDLDKEMKDFTTTRRAGDIISLADRVSAAKAVAAGAKIKDKRKAELDKGFGSEGSTRRGRDADWTQSLLGDQESESMVG